MPESAGRCSAAAVGLPLFPRQRPGRRVAWYGSEPVFQLGLEAGLARDSEHVGKVSSELRFDSDRWRDLPRVLEYRHAGLDVPARREAVPVRIEFHEEPPYPTYGLLPSEYPRVFADGGALSPHRQGDDSLCLWFPHDPDEQRWHPSDGLVALFNLVRNHLYAEHYWRLTGGRNKGTWVLAEAPHGFPTQRRGETR